MKHGDDFCTHALRFWTLVPWLLLATIYALGLRATYVLGHFPRLSMDWTPDELFCNTLWRLNEPLTVAMLISPLLFPFAIVMNGLQHGRDDWRLQVGVFTLGWGLFLYLCACDPTGIIGWWMD